MDAVDRRQPLVILADTLLDGVASEPASNPVLTVRDGRIDRVAVRGPRWRAPPDHVVLDHRGCTLLPGLIDPHVHLTMTPTMSIDAVRDEFARASASALALKTLRHVQLAALGGITTLRDCGGPGTIPQIVRDARRSGAWFGPRLLVSGAPLTTTGGHCHWMGGTADTADELRLGVRRRCEQGVDFIKIMVTGGMNTPGSNPFACQYTDQELAAAVSEAHRLGRRVAAHVLCADGIRASLAADVDTFEHCWTVTGGPQDYEPELAIALATPGKHVGVTVHSHLRPLLGSTDVDADHATMCRRLAPHRRLHEAGVAIMVHSDAGVPGTLFEEFAQSVEGMWDPLESTCRHASLSIL